MPGHTDLYFGASHAWVRVQEEIEGLAPSDLPLVLLGPTGSGKTVVAGYIHAKSKRPGILNTHTLGSVPDELSYSAFLGHVKGAFTGAIETRVGTLETAKGGTLFIDEIGIASERIQHLLLGLLEGRPFAQLGASRPVTIDVRLIFATNEEPEVLVANRKWRPDFYYRLGGNFIRLPSLASRKPDILPLADLFLHRRLRMMGRPWRARLSPAVQDVFLSHPWPGNIRELQSVCDRAAVLMQCEREVEMGDLTTDFMRELPTGSQQNLSDPMVARVHETLRRHYGNKTAAARELDMSRTELYRFLERFPRHTPPGGLARPN